MGVLGNTNHVVDSKDLISYLKEGPDVWNRWRRNATNQVRPDLSGSNLKELDLQGADLSNAIFIETRLDGTNLARANFSGAILNDASLQHSFLRRANLQWASLAGADLRNADLTEADLTGVNLGWALLSGSQFHQAVLAYTSFCNVDLSCIEGLKSVEHRGRSTVGTDSLSITARNLANKPCRRSDFVIFLERCGVSRLEIKRFLEGEWGQDKMCSAFISYATADEEFAELLYKHLSQHSVACWKADPNLKVGDEIFPVVKGAVRGHDKFILCCSEKALSSYWVRAEIQAALTRERESGDRIILPLMLDDAFNKWEGPVASELRERKAADFRQWRDAQQFALSLEKLVTALRLRE